MILRSMSKKWKKKKSNFFKKTFFSQNFSLDTYKAILKILPWRNWQKLIFFDTNIEIDWKTLSSKKIDSQKIFWKHEMQFWHLFRNNFASRPTSFSSISKVEKQTEFYQNQISSRSSFRHIDCSFDNLAQQLSCQRPESFL